MSESVSAEVVEGRLTEAEGEDPVRFQNVGGTLTLPTCPTERSLVLSNSQALELAWPRGEVEVAAGLRVEGGTCGAFAWEGRGGALLRPVEFAEVTVEGSIALGPKRLRRRFGEGLRFTRCELRGDVGLQALDVEGPTRFEGCHVQGTLQLGNAKDERERASSFGEVVFKECKFGGGVDLSGVTAAAIRFEDCLFSGELDLRSLQVEGEVVFDRCRWSGVLDFSPGKGEAETRLGGPLVLRTCEGDGVLLRARRDALSAHSLRVSGCVFQADVIVQRVDFSDRVEVRDTRVEGVLRLGNAGAERRWFCTIGGDFEVEGATVGELDVSEVQVRGEARWDRCRVLRHGDLRGLEVEGCFALARSHFEGEVDARGPSAGESRGLRQGVKFEEVVFGGAANFSGWVVGETAQLRRVTFTHSARFDEARFTGLAEFGEGPSDRLRETDGAEFIPAVWFQGRASFRRARFARADFSECRFEDLADLRDVILGDADAPAVTHDFRNLRCAGELDLRGLRLVGGVFDASSHSKLRREGTRLGGPVRVEVEGERAAELRWCGAEFAGGLWVAGGGLGRLDLTGATVQGGELRDLEVAEVWLDHATVVGVRLALSTWQGKEVFTDAPEVQRRVSLRGHGAQLRDLRFEGDLRGPAEVEVELRGATLVDCAFRRLELGWPLRIEEARLRSGLEAPPMWEDVQSGHPVRLGGSEVSGVRFVRTVFETLDLRAATVEGASFEAGECGALLLRRALQGQTIELRDEIALSEEELTRLCEDLHREFVEVEVRVADPEEPAAAGVERYVLVREDVAAVEGATDYPIVVGTRRSLVKYVKRRLLERHQGARLRGVRFEGYEVERSDGLEVNAPPELVDLHVVDSSFRGPVFAGARLVGSFVVEGACVFEAEGMFADARFEGSATFRDAHFMASREFTGAEFTGPLRFEAVLADKGLDLTEARVRASCVIRGRGGRAPGEGGRSVLAGLRCAGANFDGELRLQGLWVRGRGETTRSLDLSQARVLGDLKVLDVEVESGADEAALNLSGAEVGGRVVLEGIDLGVGVLDLGGLECRRTVSLGRVVWGQSEGPALICEGARVDGDLVLEALTLRGRLLDLRSLECRGRVEVESSGVEGELLRCRLWKLDCRALDVPQDVLKHVEWAAPQGSAHDEDRQARARVEEAEFYARLQVASQRLGREADARECYALHMEKIRHMPWSALGKAFESVWEARRKWWQAWLGRWYHNHGRDAWRILVAILAVGTLCSGLYSGEAGVVRGLLAGLLDAPLSAFTGLFLAQDTLLGTELTSWRAGVFQVQRLVSGVMLVHYLALVFPRLEGQAQMRRFVTRQLGQALPPKR